MGLRSAPLSSQRHGWVTTEPSAGPGAANAAAAINGTVTMAARRRAADRPL
ncbi:hypothetical protein [Paractinoplanes globisporus]|uniref:hypothetical protein n=1 Tax=Paractinoplanes globisporus TaxID=113565 RepID=UPI001FDF1B10|nr:hypothetical protein [Actinoplanes globisporus]